MKGKLDQTTWLYILVAATLVAFAVYISTIGNPGPLRARPTFDTGFYIALSLFLAVAAFVAIRLLKRHPK